MARPGVRAVLEEQHEGRPAGRAGGWDPVQRLKDMDIDGVEAEVLHCGVAGVPQNGSDQEARLAFARATNDAMTAWCDADPSRLIPVGTLPIWDVEEAVTELKRVHQNGFKVVQVPIYPDSLGLKPYVDRSWEPLWSTAQELPMPLHLHVGSNNGLERVQNYDPTPSTGIFMSLPPLYMAEALGCFILGGVLERFPALHIVLVESGLTWIGYYLERLDTMMTRHRWVDLDPPMLKNNPSFYWRRQGHASFEEDRLAVQIRHAIGVDNILWATDYPHPDSTWPESQKVVEEHFGAIPAAEREKIIFGNANKLYRLGK
jgi:predicted TIM-barrel fold metal-dependent hydrolase